MLVKNYKSTRLLHFDVVFFSFFFSLLFCAFCALVDKLMRFWIFLELCRLSLIPSFFYNSKIMVHSFYNSLLNYIMMSGVSSALMVSGLLFKELYYFIFVGFGIKFGLFPFSFWIYRIFSKRGWFFIFFFSVVLKFPILFFCFLYQLDVYCFVFFDCLLTILLCSLLFWICRPCWEFVWCHISLSSVSTLIVRCFCRDSLICFFIYFYYFVWGVLCVFYFSKVNRYWRVKSYFWWYCFLLLVTPVSFPLFYKLSVCLAIFYSSFYVLIGWCIYRFSEQFFLYKLGGDYLYSMVFKKWVR